MCLEAETKELITFMRMKGKFIVVASRGDQAKSCLCFWGQINILKRAAQSELKEQ